MTHKILIAAVLTVFALSSSHVLAQKLYKIVDEQGNVTFSQFPPKEKSENTIVEGVQVNSAGGKDTVRYVGSSAYCGDIRLPTPSKSSSSRSNTYYAERVQSSLSNWRDRLRSIEQSSQERARRKLNRGTSSSISYSAEQNSRYQKDLDRDTKRMRELRCAIDWAENRNASSSEQVRTAQQESKRLEQVHEELEARMIAQCGREPLLDPTDARNAKDRRQWRACSKKYRNDLRKVERAL